MEVFVFVCSSAYDFSRQSQAPGASARSRPGSSRDYVDILLPAFVHNIAGPERLERPDVACGLDLAHDSVRYLITRDTVLRG